MQEWNRLSNANKRAEKKKKTTKTRKRGNAQSPFKINPMHAIHLWSRTFGNWALFLFCEKEEEDASFAFSLLTLFSLPAYSPTRCTTTRAPPLWTFPELFFFKWRKSELGHLVLLLSSKVNFSPEREITARKMKWPFLSLILFLDFILRLYL